MEKKITVEQFDEAVDALIDDMAVEEVNFIDGINNIIWIARLRHKLFDDTDSAHGVDDHVIEVRGRGVDLKSALAHIFEGILDDEDSDDDTT